MNTRLKTLCTILALLCMAGTVYADKVEIRLRTGATWRGDSADTVDVSFNQNGVPIDLRAKIVRIEDLYIVVREVSGANRNWTIFRADITAMKSVDAASDATDVVASNAADAMNAGTAAQPTGSDAYNDKTLGVFMLPLIGPVGDAFRHDEIERLAEEADKYGPGQIIVLDIHSGGGLAYEMLWIHETIKEVKKRHRVVAWVGEAISAAAGTAINCDEIYFRTDGTLGAITAHAGGQAIPESEQMQNLGHVRDMMALGGRPEFIADAMVLARAQLSYDVDPVTGEVTWHPDTSGEFVLSNNRQNLVLTSSQAIHSKFADGIADTKEELGELLGLPKWHEKSDYGLKLAEDIKKLYERGNREIPLLLVQYNIGGAGRGAIAQLQQRIQALQQLMRWWDLHENLCHLNGVPTKEEIKLLIEQTRKQIARMRR